MNYQDTFCVNRWIEGLTPIKITLPKPPKKEFIANNNKEKENQFFRREVYPEKLTQLEKKIRQEIKSGKEEVRDLKATEQEIIIKIWEALEKNYDFYEKEINWIKGQWYYRLYGYFFYNNGEITYIDGWHWLYLNYWYMGEAKGHHPEYRERDREQFLIMRYIYTTKETFKEIDPITLDAVLNSEGEYEMVEKGDRTFLAGIQPKNRRGGNTNIGFCVEYDILTQAKGVVYGLNQSFSKEQIDKTWAIMQNAFKYMAFFFKPQWQGREVPEDNIEFKSYKIRNQLGSTISMAPNGGSEDYGKGTTALFRLYDESGESQYVDQEARWVEGINTLSEGAGSHLKGLAYLPTTVSEAYGDAAKQYLKLFSTSNFYRRGILSGHTETKSIGIFFPAWYCMTGFIGKYGESIHDTPTEQQIKNGFKEKYGSKEFIQRTIEEYLLINTEESLKKLRKFRKQYPTTLQDLYLESEVSRLDYNYEGFEKRKFNILHSRPPLTIRYKIRWENDQRDTNVVIEPDANGSVVFSKQFNRDELNKKVKTIIRSRSTGRKINTWCPENLFKGVIGADPYQTLNITEAELKKKRKILSDGGMAGRPRNERFILSYLDRPSKLDNNLMYIDEELKNGEYSFCEIAIMLCVFLGYRMFPEHNIMIIEDYFMKRGYEGYLLYDKENNGKYKNKAGIYSNTETKIDLFEANKQYMQTYLNVECHSDIIEQFLNIKNMKDMTNHDLFTAAACANVGNDVLNEQIVEKVKHETSNKLAGAFQIHSF